MPKAEKQITKTRKDEITKPETQNRSRSFTVVAKNLSFPFRLFVLSCFRDLLFGFRLWTLMVLLVAVVLACALPVALGEAPEAAPPDPVPIRRVLLTPERIPAEMEHVRQGALVQMPLADFDDLLRRAGRVAAGLKNPPRLIEAHYGRAELRDNSLVGKGKWKVLHTGPGPGLLPLQPLSLALRQPTFEDENREALIADFDGRTPALLLEAPGEHTVAFEWSARGEARPEGLHFDLQFPSCAVAFLELDLPADRAVSVAEGVLLIGPGPADAADYRRWKIGCGKRSQVNVLVRPAEGSGQPPPVVFVRRQRTTQEVRPDGLDARYEFDLEAPRQGSRELRCAYDPSLRPTEVSVRGLEEWKVLPGPTPDASRILTIRLNEPLREGSLQIRCLAPLFSPPTSDQRPSATVPWTSPGMRLLGAVPRGETLTLHFHPELRVEDWDPGGFRLTAATPDADRGQRLTLEGGGVEAARRPRARVRSHGVDFRARQLAWWQLRGNRPALTLQISYEIVQGPLFQLPVLLPPDWEVERVELNPPGLLRNRTVRTENGRPLLVVDLQRPLTAGPLAATATAAPVAAAAVGGGGRPRPPTLTVYLRPIQAGDFVGKSLPFPDVVPLGARFREGALAIDFDEQVYRPVFQPPLNGSEPEEDGPWGRQVPDFYHAYRGQPPTGTLRLAARPPLVRAQCSSEVVLAAGGAKVETRLLLEAEAGRPTVIDLYQSASGGGGGDWRVEQGDNRVRSAERWRGAEAGSVLGVLASANAVEAAVLLAARPGGEHWRLTLARPLHIREPLLLHATRKLESRSGRWNVPLPAVLGAERMEGEVTLHLVGSDLIQAETFGLREARPVTALAPPRARMPTPWRTFRYTSPAIGLTLRGQALAADHAAEMVADHALLTTFVGRDGPLENHFSFQVVNWPQRTLPVRLPPGAHPLVARVDGAWLPSLAFSEAGAEGVLLELPVPDGGAPGTLPEDAVHHFEMVYVVNVPAWKLWARVEAPTPKLPVALRAFRRTWRLPPGVSPLSDGHLRRLPGPGEGYEADEGAWRPGELFRLSRALPRPWQAEEGQAAQRQALADAALGLRTGRAGQSLTLREIVDQVTFEYLRQSGPLVVDDTALREAEVGPQTVVKIEPPTSPEDVALPWEALGLVTVHARAAPLLTTRRQLELWQAAARPGLELPNALEVAVTEAATNGYDSSGRFRAAPRWSVAAGRRLMAGNDSNSTAPTSATDFFATSAALVHWTEWEPLAGAAEEDVLLVVRSEATAAAGLALTALLGLVFWRVGRGKLAFLLLWLAAAGLGLFWLPTALLPVAWWPFLAGWLIALAWHLRSAARASTRGGKAPSTAVRGTALAGVLAALLAGILAGQAAAPTGPAVPTSTIYLVPGPADAPDKPNVLIPPELLDQLKALARPGLPGAAPAVLLSAQYDGKIVDKVAQFDAVFQVHCLGDEVVSLPLPLEGVELQGDVWLDGARAHLVALAPPQVGYALKVRGSGRHKIELHFQVRVTGKAPDYDTYFTVPGLAQSRLTLKAPPGAGPVQALAKQGAQHVTEEADGPRLEVDLGRLTTPVHLRWHLADAPGMTAKVQFREAYLWDLGADASGLTALLHYDVSGGSVSAVDVDLPAGLVVRGAEAHAAPGAPADGPLIRLRDWSVSGTGSLHTLRLVLQGPVSGAFQVTLDLAPATPLAATTVLPVPVPRGTPLPDGSFLGYRTHGLDARLRPDKLLRITGIPAAKFAPFWPASARPDPLPDYACTFRREGDQGPVLGLQLHPHPATVDAAQDVTVRVGRQQAEVQLSAELTAPRNDLAFVEWEILSPQPFTVARVSGPDVRSWSQSGNRLQVWLERTTGSTRVEVFGWLPLAPAAAGSRLELPCLHVPAARTQSTEVHLTAKAGLSLAEDGRARGLFPLPDPRPSDQQLAYVAGQPVYGGTFEVRAGAASAVARVLTFVEVSDRQLNFVASVDYRVRRGELRTVSVRLRNWDGDDVRVEGRDAVPRRERRRGPGDRTWTLDLPAGVVGPYRLTLRGSLSLGEVAGGVRMPEITVPGVEHPEYFLAVAGHELTAEAPAHLTALADAAALSAWPGEAERLRRVGGSAWKATGPDWNLRLRPTGPATAPAAVRVFLTERAAEVVDGHRWLHEAVFWLRHEANTDLNVTLPADAVVVAASIDGVEATPLQPEPRRLWLPLPGRAGVRRVRLRWLYDLSAERLDRPNLERLRLEGALDGPTVWNVHVPPGYRPEHGEDGGLKAGPARSAALDLYRAAAQLDVSAALAEQERDGSSEGPALAAAQRRFYIDCRLAEYALERAGASGETGPAGQSLADWHQELTERNRSLAQTHGFEAARAEAEHRVRTSAAPVAAPVPVDTAARLADLGPGRVRIASREGLPDRGTPFLGVAGPDTPAPRLVLETNSGRDFQTALTASELLLVLLAAVWFLSHFPALVARVRLFWPEQMLLLGGLGWYLAGPTFVTVFLLLLGVCGRLIAIARWIRLGFRWPVRMGHG
jgi:hypothetical protein